MKSKPLSLIVAAALLLPALVPGAALAVDPSNLDQYNIHDSSNITDYTGNGGTVTLGQTFTAGKSGIMSGVDLQITVTPATTVEVRLETLSGGLPSGTILAQAYASVPTGSADEVWTHFPFWEPATVTAGTKYALVVTFTGNYGPLGQYADTYAHGELYYWVNSGWTLMTAPHDLFFMTYVDSVAATTQWDKTSVTAGTSTALSLTMTFVYKNGDEASDYSILAPTLPAWFHASGIACSTNVVHADCTLMNLLTVGALTVAPVSNGATVTVTLTGNAMPLATDAGSTGTATSIGCLDYTVPTVRSNSGGQARPNDISPDCGSGSAGVQVVAPADPTGTPAPTSATTVAPATAAPTANSTPAVTLPPTSSSKNGSNGGSTDGSYLVWFLFGLLPISAVALLLTQRRRYPSVR